LDCGGHDTVFKKAGEFPNFKGGGALCLPPQSKTLDKKAGRSWRTACSKEELKTISCQTARSLRKERMAPMPNGSNIKAPAMTVDASGTGTATSSPPGLEEFQETDPSLPLAMPKVGP
jgi:hypothetical protein